MTGRASSTASDEGYSPTGNYRIVALIVAVTMLMEQIDATILATALPTIAREFHEPVNNLSILLTTYLLALAIFIPVSGRAADRFGTRNMLCAAMLVFVGSSLFCAFAPGLDWMAAARFLQGAGGAMMIPVGRLALLRVARKDQMVQATAWMVTPALLGPILGPPLGGLIITHLDWRWIFYINLPTCALGLAATWLYIDDFRMPAEGRFDWIGFAICGIGLGCLLLGGETASRPGGFERAMLYLAIAMVMGVIYVRHARRHPLPLLDLTLLHDRSFRISLMGGSLVRFTQGAHPFLLPLLFQIGFGMAPAASGSIVLSTAIGALLAKFPLGWLLRTFGFRSNLIANALLASLFYGMAAAFRSTWPVPLIMADLVLAGFFMSITFTIYNTVAYETIEHERMSRAAAFYTTFQQLLMSLGVCAAALVLHASMLVRGRTDPTLPDISVAFVVVALIAASAVFVNIRFPANAGAAMSGHRVDELEAA